MGGAVKNGREDNGENMVRRMTWARRMPKAMRTGLSMVIVMWREMEKGMYCPPKVVHTLHYLHSCEYQDSIFL